MRIIILLITTLFASTIGAESAFTDTKTNFIFPEKIASLVFVKKHDYGEEELGYGLSYRSESGTLATIIVFNYGIEEIEEGIEGEQVRALFEGAKNDIRAAQERGRYKSVEVLPDLEDLESVFLASSYNIVTDNELDLNSYLLFRGQNNHFLKIRISGENKLVIDGEASEFVNQLLPVLGIEKALPELPAVSP